jgi:hypothetical protein
MSAGLPSLNQKFFTADWQIFMILVTRYNSRYHRNKYYCLNNFEKHEDHLL